MSARAAILISSMGNSASAAPAFFFSVAFELIYIAGRGGPGWPPVANPFYHLGRQTCWGAEDETRTRDLNLGKVALYQLSYFRLLIGGIWQPGGKILPDAVPRPPV